MPIPSVHITNEHKLRRQGGGEDGEEETRGGKRGSSGGKGEPRNESRKREMKWREREKDVGLVEHSSLKKGSVAAQLMEAIKAVKDLYHLIAAICVKIHTHSQSLTESNFKKQV